MTKISLILFLLGMTVCGTNAFGADVSVSPCPKNSKLMLVEIDGESALNLFRTFSGRINMKPADVRNIETNDMVCDGSEFTAEGDVLTAKCSFVMKGQKNIPFPQIDPGFSGEEIIHCK